MTVARTKGSVIPLDEAIEQLQSPYALEAFSALTGEPVLVVDLSSTTVAPSKEALARVRETLAQLPCPSVALCTDLSTPGAQWLGDRFDVVVGEEEELALILKTSQRTPLAAMSLVQLLRHTEKLSIHEGLIAESWVYSKLQSGPEFAAWRARHHKVGERAANAEPAVLIQRSGPRVRLTLNRPEKHNAYCAEMRDGLVEGLQLARSDPSVEAVVLAGAGSSFCAGGDLDEFGTLPDPATAHAVRSTRNAARQLAAIAERVEAELHGACIGAGIELPAFAGHVSASEDAFFQLPEVQMGLIPGAGGSVSIPRRIGRQRTALLALTGLRLRPEQALRWGLIDRITRRDHAGA